MCLLLLRVPSCHKPSSGGCLLLFQNDFYILPSTVEVGTYHWLSIHPPSLSSVHRMSPFFRDPPQNWFLLSPCILPYTAVHICSLYALHYSLNLIYWMVSSVTLYVLVFCLYRWTLILGRSIPCLGLLKSSFKTIPVLQLIVNKYLLN